MFKGPVAAILGECLSRTLPASANYLEMTLKSTWCTLQCRSTHLPRGWYRHLWQAPHGKRTPLRSRGRRVSFCKKPSVAIPAVCYMFYLAKKVLCTCAASTIARTCVHYSASSNTCCLSRRSGVLRARPVVTHPAAFAVRRCGCVAVVDQRASAGFAV